MNCEQFSSMLIGPVFGRPPAQQLMAARLHLSGCRHCGVDWEIHSRLVAMPVPAMPDSLEGRCRAAVARAGGGWDGRPGPGRGIILGTVLVVAAAAAAMVGLQRKDVAQSAVPFADAVLAEPLSAPALDTDPGPAASADRGSVQDSGAGTGKDRHEDIAQALYPQGFTVTLYPLIHEIEDRAGRTAAERHYQALVAQLQAVPRLRLVIPGRTGDDAAAANADFRITARSKDAISRPDPRKEVRSWSVWLRVDGRRPGGMFGLLTTTLTVCSGQEEGAGYCTDPMAATSRAVDAIRESVFFPAQRKDASEAIAESEAFNAQRTAESIAGLANRALPFQTRLRALAFLTPGIGRPTWNDDIVRDALGLAGEAEDDLDLIQVWRHMRGIAHPDILQPALDLLNSGVPYQVRVVAATVVTESFGADAAARPTLERLAADSSAGLVGQLAARTIHGEVAWRDSVLGTLRDADRPPADRFEPIAYMLDFSTPTQIRLFLEDEGILAALSPVLAQLWTQRGVRTVGLVEQLGQVRQPLAADILLRVARETQYKATAIEALGREPIRHAHVREELQKIASSDSEPPGIREMARQALANASMYVEMPR